MCAIRLRSLTILAPGAAAGAAVVTLAFASGGYFPSDHGLLTLAFAIVVLTSVFAIDEMTLDRRSIAFVAGAGGIALWALVSVLWSPAAAWPVLEFERGQLYTVAAAALVLVVSRERVTSLLAGVASGITVVAVYALATRLFPGRVGGAYDPSAGYQLADPIGYWNALGLLLAVGILLVLGCALHGVSSLRVPAGAALVPLGVALYFTFSRGALVALAAGVVVLLALRPRGIVGLLVLGLTPAAAVALASRSSALTGAGETLETAQAQGERLTWQLSLLAAVSALFAWAYPRVSGRVRIPRGLVQGLGLATAIIVAAIVVGSVLRAGGPVALAERGLEAFRREPPATAQELDRRLLSVSGHGRADYWRVAAGMVARDPLLGEGAGGFERHWMEERSAVHNARDAHNLYLETLAELGPVGLALLLVALGAPLTGLGLARHGALAPAAAAAYAAFLVHAGVDWDWELPLLVLVALACSAVLIAEARISEPRPLGAIARGAGIAAVASAIAVALVAHVGNRAVAESAAALERADTDVAMESARRARAWMPWSHEPWQLLGEAQLAARDDLAARRSLEEAIQRAPEEWRLWFDLAIVSEGPAARRAITRARELNPLGHEILELGQQ